MLWPDLQGWASCSRLSRLSRLGPAMTDQPTALGPSFAFFCRGRSLSGLVLWDVVGIIILKLAGEGRPIQPPRDELPTFLSVDRQQNDRPTSLMSFVFLSFLDLVHQFKRQAPRCSPLVFRLPRLVPGLTVRPSDRPPWAPLSCVVVLLGSLRFGVGC